jgi:membrane protein
MAASLAFYMALSLAPLLILFVTITSHFSDELQMEFLAYVRGLVGVDAAHTVAYVIDSARERNDLSSLAGFFGIGTILISAGLIFGQLRSALNRIFAVPALKQPWSGWIGVVGGFLRERVASIGLALIFVCGMILSLLGASVVTAVVQVQRPVLLEALNTLVSFVFFTGLFTVVFRYIPDRHQPWHRAWRGGILTALLFEIGKQLLSIYIGRSAVASAYGAAGSLIALLIWVYYSTLITFIGAQVSSIWNKS